MVGLLRKIADNWKLKALAFGLAVLLWVVVTADQPTTGWFSVPLDVVITDPNYRLEGGDIPEEVEVRFVGPGRDMFDLALRRPTLRLTVNDVDDEVEARALDPRMVQLPGQMAVDALDVRPAAVQLEFTRIASKDVPIRPTVSANLGEEWAVVDTLETDPPSVRVTGPVRTIDRIEALGTQPLRLTEEDTLIDVEVALDTTELSGIQFSARRVRVTGRVDRVIQRTITNVAVDVGPGIAILPTVVAVTLEGPATVVESITPELFRVVISISEIPTRIPAGGVTVPLRIDGLRPGIEAVLSPPQVRLFPEGQDADDANVPPEVVPGQGASVISTTPRIQ